MLPASLGRNAWEVCVSRTVKDPVEMDRVGIQGMSRSTVDTEGVIAHIGVAKDRA